MLKLLNYIALFATLLFGLGHLKPADSIIDAFQLGKERSYSLVNHIAINDFKGGHPIGYELTGTLKVGSVWGTDEKKLLKFTLTAPTLAVKASAKSQSFKSHASNLDTTDNHEFYALWNLGQITKLYVNKKEDSTLIDFKKALASLFQYQLIDGTFVEDDVAGKCDVTYLSKSNTHYIKTKENCQNEDLAHYSRSDRPIGVSIESTRVADLKVTQDGTLDKIESREFHHISIVANKKAGGSFDSVLSLKFDGSISNIATISSNEYKEAVAQLPKGLKALSVKSSAKATDDSANISLKKIVREHITNLTDIMVGTKQSAFALVQILPIARQSTKDEIVQVLQARSTQELRGQIFDILGAAQTLAAHQAVAELIDLTSDKEIDLVERYLQALAIGTRPTVEIIELLFDLITKPIENVKIKDTLIQTIASMGYRYARLMNENYESPIVTKIGDYLLTELKKCSKKECKIMHIRGLNNLQAPKSADILLDYALDPTDRLVSVVAMKGVKQLPSHIWTATNKKQFEDVFLQRFKKYDPSSRTMALDILLELRPNELELEELMQFLRSYDQAFEVKQFLLQKIQMISEQCDEFKATVQNILKNNPLLNNYHIFGQKGLSTALARPFSKSPSFNGTLSSVQEVFGGLLKRGIVDMTIDTHDTKFSVFTLGLYAGGLTSFMGNTDLDEAEKSETATAGMEIAVQGSNLRPLEFFNGQGELMGHVWSGTASTATPAYTATTILQDHEQQIRLHNGAILSINILGGLSIDLNGQIQMSLWNRNAHCQVDKFAGIAINGGIRLDTNFISLNYDFKIEQEPQLNLESDIEFASDVKLCMQLSQPETVLTHQIVKSEKIPNTKYHVRRSKNFEYHISGFTHLLNQKNNEMCGEILQ